MKTKIKDLELRGHMIMWFMLTILLPFLITYLITVNIIAQRTYSYMMSMVSNSVNQINNGISDTLQAYCNTCNRLINNDALRKYLDLNKNYRSNLEIYYTYQRIWEVSYGFDLWSYSNTKLKVYFYNPSLMSDYYTYWKTEPENESQTIIRKALNQPAVFACETSKEKTMLARACLDAKGRTIAVFLLEIDNSVFSSQIKEYSDEQVICIINDEGLVVASNVDEYQGLYTNNQKLAHLFGERPSKGYIPIDTPVITQLDISNHWRVAAFVQVGTIRAEQSTVNRIALLVFLAAFVIGTMGFTRIVNGYYRIHLQLKDVEILRREAEMYSLQSQIQPHFLFNVLESVRMKIKYDDCKRAEQIIVNLSKILRASIDRSREFYKLSEEINLIKDYIDIYNMRFEDSIEFHRHIPAELENCTIPKLIIQPLIENALKHGFDLGNGRNVIILSARTQGTNLLISIQDDGCGIDEEKMVEIKNFLYGNIAHNGNDKEAAGIGLRNVQERLRLYYGDIYGIDLISQPGAGTTVTVRSPLIIDGLYIE